MSVVHEQQSDGEVGPDAASGARVPVINLGLDGSGGDADVVRAVGAACENSGFLVVTGHGIPGDVIRAMRAQTARLFEETDEFKARLGADPADPLFRGFVAGRVEMMQAFTVNALEPVDAEQLPPDVDETLTLPNKWPPIPGFQEAYTAYLAAVDGLARWIMRVFASCLRLPQGWFDDSFTPHMSSLTANYYPAQPTGPAPGRLRKMAHRDWGALTILHRDENSGGLQVHDRDGQWVEVPDVPDSFVVNIGDLMAIWTNGDWSSTVHRVVNPSAEEAHRERYSVAYFFQPSPAAMIAPVPGYVGPSATPRHEPVRADAYFAAQRRRAFILQRVMEGRVPEAG
ncbi:isopenicillin N synthase family dioxygenase [Streptomyces hainanensis]|uniref:Isopenicillin N synthase family oxygenase n=1 Tax=Streptomyces hainanensis TaxID=402648 RepID=A0A4R4TML4_9ACTN|nr:2OG-Fe(II) oxygenase family protein [Streptomyces hainanensis]TDC79207.1 isopenicillin N synthase family oxygenase [Streptomyces hainanensis]